MSVGNARGGNSERGEFGQVGRLEEITGKEYTYPRQEILTEILNLRTLHPLCRFSQPQGTHSDGYLATAEWVETLTRFCEQPERWKCKLQGFSSWACEELNTSGMHRRRGPSCTSILPKLSSSFFNTMKNAIKWFAPNHTGPKPHSNRVCPWDGRWLVHHFRTPKLPTYPSPKPTFWP